MIPGCVQILNFFSLMRPSTVTRILFSELATLIKASSPAPASPSDSSLTHFARIDLCALIALTSSSWTHWSSKSSRSVFKRALHNQFGEHDGVLYLLGG